MRFLIVIFAFIPLATSQTFSCTDGLNKCESAYNQSIPNDQGSHGIYCQITNVLIQCVEALAGRVECTNNMDTINRLRKKSQENINMHNCGGTGAATQCQADLDSCQRTLVAEIALAGHNAAAQCQAATKFISCLNARDRDPSCVKKKSNIDDLRKKYQESFDNAGCGQNANTPGENCNADVEDCETRFISAVTKAGKDVNAACIAGSTLETCLQGRERLDECKDAKSTIDNVRKSYKEQIDADGCGSAHARQCVQGITSCTTTYNSASPQATTPDAQCQTANTYIDCLNAVSCSSAYRGQLQQGAQMVQNMVKGTSCTLKPLGGGASRNVPVLTAFILIVVAARVL